jgi:hypothetical protein
MGVGGYRLSFQGLRGSMGEQGIKKSFCRLETRPKMVSPVGRDTLQFRRDVDEKAYPTSWDPLVCCIFGSLGACQEN